MYQILAYLSGNPVLVSPVVLTDMTAIPDENFSARGGATGFNHWLFTENYELNGDYYTEANPLQATWNVPTWNVIGQRQIYNANTGVIPQDNAQIEDLRGRKVWIPLNEEIAVASSQSGSSGNEDAYVLLWIAPPRATDPTRMIDPNAGLFRDRVLFTSVNNETEGTWSPYTGLSPQQTLKGGNYQVNGMDIISPLGLAFKISFVRPFMNSGRKLTPGGLCVQNIAQRPWREFSDWMGVMGVFNNFELPQISVLSDTTQQETLLIYMDLTYLGVGTGVANQPGIGGNTIPMR